MTSALLGALSAATVAAAVVQATSRQIEHSGAALTQTVGWSHTASAAGSLLGVWLGIGLGVRDSPILGAVIAAGIATVAFVILKPGVESPSATEAPE